MHSLRHPNAPWRRTVIPGVELDAVPDEEEPRSPGGRLAAGALVLFIGTQLFRWGWWTDVGGHTQDVGYVGQSVDGFAGALAAAGLVLTIRARSGATSGFRVVQLLPIVLGLISLALALSGFQQTYTEMASHQGEGRPAGLDVGVWLAIAGGILGTLAGWRATRARLTNPLHRDAALAFEVVAPGLAVAALGVPVWLIAWTLAGHFGGGAVGVIGLLLSPIVSFSLWRWLRGDGMSERERRESIEAGAAVPMDRLHERGRNR